MDNTQKLLEELAKKIDGQVREDFTKEHLETDEMPSEEDIEVKYNEYFQVFSMMSHFNSLNVDREHFLRPLINSYKEIQPYRKRIGFAYADEEYTPWVDSTVVEGGFYWQRYRKYLIKEKHWDPATVNTLDEDTSNILDYLADPSIGQPFKRKGLVVASVQSGKTANYIGLISKAADAKYKIIIVLAGITNKLRNQTQQRIEEGFAGLDISQKRKFPVGVGLIDDSRFPAIMTSRIRDYNKATADANRGIFLKQLNENILFVIKKNVNSLRGIISWLKDNCSRDDALLLIDDEADNASINVKYGKDEISRINGQIRTILDWSERNAYVGYTATPFANVLIDPDSLDEKVGADIFPKNFIYTLEQSPAYFGAEKVFSDAESNQPKHLRWINDIEDIIPPKHKSDMQISMLPDSLYNALNCFIVACAERVLRGQEKQHMSMMINVSPYKLPQQQVAILVEEYIDKVKQAFHAYAGFPYEEAKEYNPVFQELKNTWSREYQNISGHKWNDIYTTLRVVVKDVKRVVVNSSNTADELVYPEEEPQRLIAIGGYSLSRGLTLEGLMISYYSRNARAYDSLMQMARWFGYRFGYEDLCRVWMTQQSADWYSFVTDATVNLIDELRSMRDQRSTPRRYGLFIQKDPEALEITARNKFGKGSVLDHIPVQLDGRYVETRALLRDESVREKNEKVVQDTISELEKGGYRDINAKQIIYRDIPMYELERFLRRFDNDDDNSPASENNYIINHLNLLEERGVHNFDLMVAANDNTNTSTFTIPGLCPIHRQRRMPGSRSNKEVLYVGNKQNSASPGEERYILSLAEIDQAEKEYRDTHPDRSVKTYPSSAYRKLFKQPLLVIRPLVLGFENENTLNRPDYQAIKNVIPNCDPSTWENNIGWSLSMPKKGIKKAVDIVCNEVYRRNMSGEYQEEIEAIEEEDFGDLD